MFKNKNTLERMILLSPEIYVKLKDFLNQDVHLTAIEKKLKQIMSNKKLKQIDKLYLYRQLLLKHPRSSKINNEHKKSYTMGKTTDIATQTKFIPKEKKEKKETSESSTQTDVELKNISPEKKIEEEIFESKETADSDEEEEDRHYKQAMSVLGEGAKLKKKKVTNPKAKHRMFVDEGTGSVITTWLSSGDESDPSASPKRQKKIKSTNDPEYKKKLRSNSTPNWEIYK